MIVPRKDHENFTGKAYTIRDGESLVDWLIRGTNESGEAREKFKKTVYHNVRMAMRDRAYAGIPGGYANPPDPQRLRQAYREVRDWAVGISRTAGLNEWAAELLPAAVQRAHAILSQGPNVCDLIAYCMQMLLDPSGRKTPDQVMWSSSHGAMADASAEATDWAHDAIMAVQVAPGNSHLDSETIAAEILAKLRAVQDGPDPTSTGIIDA